MNSHAARAWRQRARNIHVNGFWRPNLLYVVLDQAAIAGANFILSTLLARWSLPNEYGTYSIMLAMQLIILGFYTALLIEPMSVIAPFRYKDQIRGYIATTLRLHHVFTVICVGVGVLCLAISSLFEPGLIKPGIVFVFVTPFICLSWLMRRVCYLESKVQLAMFGSFVYSFLILMGLLLLRQFAWLSPITAYMLMGVAGVSSVWFYAYGLGLLKLLLTTHSSIPLRNILIENWQYGRWMSLASLAHSLGTALYVPYVGIFSSLVESAALKAVQNLMMPMQQAMTAFSLFLMPRLSADRSQNRLAPLQKAPLFMRLFLVGTIIYALLIVSFGYEILGALYAQSFYQDYVWLVYIFAVQLILIAPAQVYGVVLRVLERPQAILVAKLLSAIITIGIGPFLIQKYGLAGAATGMVFGFALELAVMIFFVQRLRREFVV